MTYILFAVALAIVFRLTRHVPHIPRPARRIYRRSLRGLDVGALLAFHKRQFGGAVNVLVLDGPVPPEDLTTFVRRVPQSDTFILDTILPNRYFDTNVVDFGELVRTNRTARFRSYDGRLHVSERDTGSAKRVPLPPLSTSLAVGEYERLQLEFARNGGTNQAVLARAIYNDGEQGTREVLNRMELARGDALSDFVVTLGAPEEPGIVADYGAPSGHLASAAVTWTGANLATMTPLADMLAVRDTMRANGQVLRRIIMSTTRVSLVQRSAEIINAVQGSAAGRTRVTRAELNALLESEDLPAIETYDANVDVDGTVTRIIADDKVVFVGDQVGYTAWGVSATALELVNAEGVDFDFEDAPGIVGVIEKVGPPYKEFTYVDAVGLPVIENRFGLAVLDVA